MRTTPAGLLAILLVAACGDGAKVPGGVGEACGDEQSCEVGLVCSPNGVCVVAPAGGGDSTDATPGGPDAGADAGGDSTDATSGVPDAGADPCGGVTCALAPAATCPTPTVRRTYDAPGDCSDGACSFDFTDTPCADACVGGACVDLSCGAGSCDDPADDVCVDAQTLRHEPAIGTCDGGTCDYAAFDSICTDGCAGSACAPGSWLVTERPSLDDASWTAITIDPAGLPQIVFIDGVDLRIASSTPAGWVEQTIDPVIGWSNVREVFAAGDGAGGLHVAYTEPANENVRYAYRAPGGTTFAVEFVSSTNALRVLALAVTDAGVPVVAYHDRTTGFVKVARRGAAGGWTVTHEANTFGTRDVILQMVLDGDGAPLIAFTSYTHSPETRIFAASLGIPAGGAWTMTDLPVDAFATAMICDAPAACHVLLSHFDGMRIAHRSAGGVWTTQTITDDIGYAVQGDLARDAAGGFHAAFTLGAAATYAHQTAVGWAVEPIFVPEFDDFDGRLTTIALDAADRPHIAAASYFGGELMHMTPAP